MCELPALGPQPQGLGFRVRNSTNRDIGIGLSREVVDVAPRGDPAVDPKGAKILAPRHNSNSWYRSETLHSNT